MLFKIAWRNIWRNRLRSWVVITSIVLGVWAGLFILALMIGMNNQRTEELLNTTISHIQIHHPDYLENNNIKDTIPGSGKVLEKLETTEGIRSYTPRTVINGMASSPVGAFGVKLNAIKPELEKKVTILHEKMQEGKYLEGISRNPVIIGNSLAEKLNVGMRSKIVLTFQSPEGDIATGAFRIAGIFKTISSKYDESTVFIKQQDLFRTIDSSPFYHEVAIMAEEKRDTDTLENKLSETFPSLKVRDWKKVSPELGYTNEVMMQMLYIVIGIIMLALAFGIVNTMLMAVLEREKELGMLMAVGMNRFRVFGMIILETVFLSILGGPLGVGFSYLTNLYFSKKGIDLSAYSEGMEAYGIKTVIYTELQGGFYFNVTLMVVVTALLAAVYPAIKALKLKPAEAVRGL